MKKFYRRFYIMDRVVMLTSIALLVIAFGIISKIKHYSIVWVLPILIFGIVCFILLLLELKGQEYLNNILKYSKHSGYKISDLEADFAKATKIGWRSRSGERWIFFIDGELMPNLIDQLEILGVEYGTEGSGRGTARYAYFHLKNGTIVKMPCSKRHYKRLEEFYGICSSMSKELSRSFSKIAVYIWIGGILLLICVMTCAIMCLHLSGIRYYVFSFVLSAPCILLCIHFAGYDVMKNINAYCKSNKLSRKTLESDFACSVHIGQKLWCGREWLFFINERRLPDLLKKSEITQIKYLSGKKGRLGFYYQDTLLATALIKQEDTKVLEQLL